LKAVFEKQLEASHSLILNSVYVLSLSQKSSYLPFPAYFGFTEFIAMLYTWVPLLFLTVWGKTLVLGNLVCDSSLLFLLCVCLFIAVFFWFTLTCLESKGYEITSQPNSPDKVKFVIYRIFSNLICTPYFPPCSVLTACTPALSFGQTPALDRESNLHSILIRICMFSPLQLENGCGLDSRIYGSCIAT
jgi:hypothetical protein